MVIPKQLHWPSRTTLKRFSFHFSTAEKLLLVENRYLEK